MLPKKLGVEFTERGCHGRLLLDRDDEMAMMPQKSDGFKPSSRV
jgi:hypothetical protein